MIKLSIFAMVVFFLLLYPYVIYPVILSVLPNRTIHRGPNSASVSLLFCAFNEEACLRDKIANLRKLKEGRPDLEILAYDDGSSDRTFTMLQDASDILTAIPGRGRMGKAHGMQLMAKRAAGDILLFTDANVILDLEAIGNLETYFADPAVGGICGKLVYTDATNSATAVAGNFYWQLEEKIKSLESATGSIMGADGSVFAIRSELYPDVPDTVLDDLTVSMAVVFRGMRLVKADDVVAYEQLVTASGDEFRRKIRISTRAYHTHMYLRGMLSQMSSLNKFKYLSHKFLRWWGGGLLMCLGLAAVSLLYAISPVAALATTMIGISLLVAGSITGIGRIGVLREIILALVATQVGVFKAMLGHSYKTWQPAESRKRL